MKEQARQEMAEEDLGGGMFDEDVAQMKTFAAKVAEPQIYENDERQQLDEAITFFNKKESLKKAKTGTRLYYSEVSDTGKDIYLRSKMEVRAPAELIIGYYMAYTNQFNTYKTTYGGGFSIGERSSDHSVIAGGTLPLPRPLQDRQILIKTLWEKLDNDTYLVSQRPVEHESVPLPVNTVRTTTVRVIKLTRITPSLTMYVRCAAHWRTQI
jgi:hypothetical protein